MKEEEEKEKTNSPLEKVFESFKERYKPAESLDLSTRLMSTRDVADILGEVLGESPPLSQVYQLLDGAGYQVNFMPASKPVWMFTEL